MDTRCIHCLRHQHLVVVVLTPVYSSRWPSSFFPGNPFKTNVKEIKQYTFYSTTNTNKAHLCPPHSHNMTESYTEENPLNFCHPIDSVFDKAGFHNKVLMVGIELSSPPPLKLSHCASPSVHNSSFVRAGQQQLVVCSSAAQGPFG